MMKTEAEITALENALSAAREAEQRQLELVKPFTSDRLRLEQELKWARASRLPFAEGDMVTWTETQRGGWSGKRCSDRVFSKRGEIIAIKLDSRQNPTYTILGYRKDGTRGERRYEHVPDSTFYCLKDFRKEEVAQ